MHLVVSAGRALALLCLCACASSAPEVEVAAPRKAAPKDPDALVLEVVVDEGSSEAERSRALCSSASSGRRSCRRRQPTGRGG